MCIKLASLIFLHCIRMIQLRTSCTRPGPPSEPSEARRARRLTSAMHSLKGTMQSNSLSAPLDVNGLANPIFTEPLPTATIIFWGGQHHKITHQRDKSSSDILQKGGGAKLDAHNSIIFFHPPTSPHRILAEGEQVLIEGVVRQ